MGTPPSMDGVWNRTSHSCVWGAALSAQGPRPLAPLVQRQALSKPRPQALRGEQLALCFPTGCSITCLSLLVCATA